MDKMDLAAAGLRRLPQRAAQSGDRFRAGFCPFFGKNLVGWRPFCGHQKHPKKLLFLLPAAAGFVGLFAFYRPVQFDERAQQTAAGRALCAAADGYFQSIYPKTGLPAPLFGHRSQLVFIKKKPVAAVLKNAPNDQMGADFLPVFHPAFAARRAAALSPERPPIRYDHAGDAGFDVRFWVVQPFFIEKFG